MMTYHYSRQSYTDADEIDLIRIAGMVWAARKLVVIYIVSFALAGCAAFLVIPGKWTSTAIVTPPESSQWNIFRHELISLRVLGVDYATEPSDVFNLFLKRFSSQQLLEEFFNTSPVMSEALSETNGDPLRLRKSVFLLSERMKAEDYARINKKEPRPFVSWILSYTDPEPVKARNVLGRYIAFVSEKVTNQVNSDIRNAISLKVKTEKNAVELERVRLTNARDVAIRRLNYSLDIANAAGIVKPVYSNGQSVKDDPDFSIALGADGIARKLEIEKALQDVAELNAGLRNREYVLSRLEKEEIKNLTFPLFRYQLSASLPVKRDGPGIIIILLCSVFLGGIISCVHVLIRGEMMTKEARLSEPRHPALP